MLKLPKSISMRRRLTLVKLACQTRELRYFCSARSPFGHQPSAISRQSSVASRQPSQRSTFAWSQLNLRNTRADDRKASVLLVVTESHLVLKLRINTWPSYVSNFSLCHIRALNYLAAKFWLCWRHSRIPRFFSPLNFVTKLNGRNFNLIWPETFNRN